MISSRARMFQSSPVAPRRTRASIVLLGLAVMLVAIVLLAIDKGAVEISIAQAVSIIAERCGVHLTVAYTAEQRATLLDIRLPRVMLGALVGAGLGVSGAAMQGLFRNPLADPTLVGISSGAALAATIVVIVGDAVALDLPVLAKLALFPAASFAGALLTTILIYRLATVAGQTVVTTLLLAGIAINALAQAFSGFLTFYATDTQIRSLTFWKLGSLGGATWAIVLVALPFISRAAK